MVEIKRRGNCDIIVLQEKELTDQKVFEIFWKSPKEIIYVVNNEEQLFGIITLGNFRRADGKAANAVNRKFTMVSEITPDSKVNEVFSRSYAIKKIPIVNEQSKIIGEYFIEDERKEPIEPEKVKAVITSKYSLDRYLTTAHIHKILWDTNIEDKDILYCLEDSESLEVERVDFKDIRSIQREWDADLILVESDEKRKLISSFCKENIYIQDSSSFVKESYSELNYINQTLILKQNQVKVLYYEYPWLDKITHFTEEEKTRLNSRLAPNAIDMASEEIKAEFFGESYSQQFFKDIRYAIRRFTKNGESSLLDHRSTYLNIMDGKRLTTDIPEESYSTIHMFGPCIVYGTMVEDKFTISSCLQRRINQWNPNSYKMMNYGLQDISTIDTLLHLNKNMLHPDDIVIIMEKFSDKMAANLADIAIPYHELSEDFDCEHNMGMWFYDQPVHVNYKGSKRIADKIFEDLQEYNYLESAGKTRKQQIKQGFSKSIEEFRENVELKKYLSYLESERLGDRGDTAGAIVMNCNPFTNGHKYLIETARNYVDVLYLFVVEEDKSEFAFKDRLNMVKAGVAGMKNVKVLPSGKFIISSATFPEYFQKSELQEQKIDMTKDIDLFGVYIAPELHITKRFAGTEPDDYVTSQYNETMKRRLENYGIEFIEIPRCKQDGRVVSASTVRNCLKSGEDDMLRKLVPDTTYAYLKTIK